VADQTAHNKTPTALVVFGISAVLGLVAIDAFVPEFAPPTVAYWLVAGLATGAPVEELVRAWLGRRQDTEAK